MYPACATDDQASSRTIRCCRSATRLPTVIVSVARTASVAPATPSFGPNARTVTARIATTPPSLDAVDRYAAMGTGAPSYVGGAHACSGTAATLKPRPTSTRTTPTVTSGARCGANGWSTVDANRPKWTLPVAAYSRPAPSRVTAVDTTLTTKNVTAASADS